MKQSIYQIIFLLFSSFAYLTAQDCDFTAEYPGTPQSVGTDTQPVQVSCCTFAGEFTHTTAYTDGKTYEVGTAIAGDYLTLRNQSDNSVLMSGTAPLTFTYNLGGDDVEVHVALNSDCDDEPDPRAITVTCQDCFCEHPDFDALVALFVNTNGFNWTEKTGWEDGALGTDCDPCSWYGVTCNTDDRVTCIDLDGATGCNSFGLTSGNNLDGMLAPNIDELTELEQLFLEGNSNLVGDLPLAFYNLTALKNTDLKLTGLTGSILPDIANLTQLESFSAGFGPIGGPIPEAFGTLTTLTSLNLFGASFSGEIPASLGNLSNLTELRLNDNLLEGCFPNELSALCGIGTTDFSNNVDLPGGGDFAAFCNDGTGSCTCSTVTLTSQTDVNNFNCTNIDGDLIIMDDNDGIDDIVDLDPIWVNGMQAANSSTVSGNVIVQNNDALLDLDGLDEILEIGGNFIIQDNAILLNNGFGMLLQSIGGDFAIENNDAPLDTDKWNSLVSIGGDLTIKDNDALQNVEGFTFLESVGGLLLVQNNPALIQIASLSNLGQVGGLHLLGNSLMTDFDFPNLHTINGSCFINALPSLVEISGLPLLETISSWLIIGGNQVLTTIDLPMLSSIDVEFKIQLNPSLEAVTGLENISSINGAFRLLDNTALSDCCWANAVIENTTGLVEVFNNNTGCDAVEDITGTPPVQEFVISLTGSKVQPTWFAVTNADKYRVQYRLQGTTDWTLKSTVNLQTIITDLEPNTFYDIRYASRVCGVWGDYGSISGFETSGCVSPEKDYDQSNSGSSQTVVLTPVDDAIRYQLKYQVAGTGAIKLKNYAGGALSKTLNNLEAASIYEIETRTLCDGGNWTDFESKVGFETSSCVPPAPTSVTHPEDTQADVTWDAQENATNYQIRYRPFGDPNWTVKGSTTTTKLLTGLTEGTNYFFQLRAKCPSWTAWSGNYTFATPSTIIGDDETANRSVDQVVNDLTFSVYPNPSNGQNITIDFENEFVRVQGIEVYDLFGNMIQKSAGDEETGLNRVELTLDSNILPGQYLVRVYYGSEFEVKRFTVIR